MKKAKLICHMASALNGKIFSEHWGNRREKFGHLYEQCHRSFNSQAWMCGRATMEKDFSDEERPKIRKSPTPMDREPFIGNGKAKSFAIAIDPKGKLGWKQNEINGDHIIEVLTEQVDDAYIYYLRQRNISYIFAGKTEIKFDLALQQLSNLFPIKIILLEGGGLINGSVLKAGLIDEISLLLLPIADATADTPTFFELLHQGVAGSFSTHLRLKEIKKLKHQVLWLKYKM